MLKTTTLQPKRKNPTPVDTPWGDVDIVSQLILLVPLSEVQSCWATPV